MFTLPNLITLIRIPCALAFLQENVVIRAIAIMIAMISDGLDGYFARRYDQTSRLGTLLDPLVDKIFVFFVLAVLIEEQKIAGWEVVSMLCRDFAVMIFGMYLILRGKFGSYQFRSIWFGKITTTLQFSVIFAIVCNAHVPSPVFFLFIVLGLLALCELYFSKLRTDVAT
jgi:CDP-diacylglycerol--glycerol-3-phosphate 3-phosphatidyltransferase